MTTVTASVACTIYNCSSAFMQLLHSATPIISLITGV